MYLSAPRGTPSDVRDFEALRTKCLSQLRLARGAYRLMHVIGIHCSLDFLYCLPSGFWGCHAHASPPAKANKDHHLLYLFILLYWFLFLTYLSIKNQYPLGALIEMQP